VSHGGNRSAGHILKGSGNVGESNRWSGRDRLVERCRAIKEGYIDYLNKLLPKVRPGGLVLAHNINAGQADRRYIEAITTNPDLETVFLSDGGGISITLKKRGLPEGSGQ